MKRDDVLIVFFLLSLILWGSLRFQEYLYPTPAPRNLNFSGVAGACSSFENAFYCTVHLVGGSLATKNPF